MQPEPTQPPTTQPSKTPVISRRGLRIAGGAAVIALVAIVVTGIATRKHADARLSEWTEDQALPVVAVDRPGAGGQKATLDIDSFPDHTFKGHVVAVSPGTGAQFSILPPQNATGNWVKVVQRVPLRIAFDKDEDTHLLRSGMSVVVDIDTGHSRIPFMSAPLKEQPK